MNAKHDENILPEYFQQFQGFVPEPSIFLGLKISPSEITSSDVLSGRGTQIYNHEGNVRFRKLVRQYKSQYKDKSAKLSEKQKQFCVAKIVAIVRFLNPSGRFLKKNDETGFWEEIGDVKAREKTRKVYDSIDVHNINLGLFPRSVQSFSAKSAIDMESICSCYDRTHDPDLPTASSLTEMIPFPTQHDDESININNIKLDIALTSLECFTSISISTIDMESICSCYDRTHDPDLPTASSLVEISSFSTQHDDDSISIHNIKCSCYDEIPDPDLPTASSLTEMIPFSTQHDDDSIDINDIKWDIALTSLKYSSSISTIDMESICSCSDRIPDPPKLLPRDNTGMSQE